MEMDSLHGACLWKVEIVKEIINRVGGVAVGLHRAWRINEGTSCYPPTRTFYQIGIVTFFRAMSECLVHLSVFQSDLACAIPPPIIIVLMAANIQSLLIRFQQLARTLRKLVVSEASNLLCKATGNIPAPLLILFM